MNDKDAYIAHLEKAIENLQNQVNNLTEMVMLLRKEKFGSSSEKTPKEQLEGQLSLFNEAESEADASITEPVKADVKGYTRTNAKTKREEKSWNTLKQGFRLSGMSEWLMSVLRANIPIFLISKKRTRQPL